MERRVPERFRAGKSVWGLTGTMRPCPKSKSKMSPLRVYFTIEHDDYSIFAGKSLCFERGCPILSKNIGVNFRPSFIYCRQQAISLASSRFFRKILGRAAPYGRACEKGFCVRSSNKQRRNGKEEGRCGGYAGAAAGDSAA